jgi:hypothetical protein
MGTAYNGSKLFRLALFAAVGSSVFAAPAFQKDVLPILQKHCQQCHRPGGIAPMSLISYRETRPWAKAIEQAVLTRKMPPWFADPAYGNFSNDPSLSKEELQTVTEWVKAGAPEGSSRDAPTPMNWSSGWSIGKPDVIFTMPQLFVLPKSGEIDYQWVIVPTNFKEDRWVERVEVQPGNRAAVHHAVIYLREPGASWLKDRPKGSLFTLSSEDPGSFTTSDILFTYTPGAAADRWPKGMAKLVKAGSDLVFQMHYTAGGGSDQSSVGLIFSREPPSQRVLTLQLNNDRFILPPGAPGVRVGAWGTLPNDAILLSLYPHMHLRGKGFEYRVIGPGEKPVTLLKVNDYDFQWQLTYRLKDPMPLAAGTRIECTATFDNSKANPHNPDPTEAVRFGFQSTQEMMIGFFDVAVAAGIDKPTFFVRQ